MAHQPTPPHLIAHAQQASFFTRIVFFIAVPEISSACSNVPDVQLRVGSPHIAWFMLTTAAVPYSRKLLATG